MEGQIGLKQAASQMGSRLGGARSGFQQWADDERSQAPCNFSDRVRRFQVLGREASTSGTERLGRWEME